MALTDSKEITEIAYKIVAMAKHPPMRQQEILAVAQVLVNLESVRIQNAPRDVDGSYDELSGKSN